MLDQTPFYAESGGQVGDMRNADVRVRSCSGNGHVFSDSRCRRAQGSAGARKSWRSAMKCEAQVDEERRRRIAANHTGTHILHAVLRDVLGTHVKQAGSLVAPDRLRFDYSHFAPLTAAEIQEIEKRINSIVFQESSCSDTGDGDQRRDRRAAQSHSLASAMLSRFAWFRFPMSARNSAAERIQS